MSTGFPFCDTNCPSIFTSPRHVARPSVFAFSYAPSVTPLCFRIHFVLFLSLRVTPTMILSIFLWVVTSFSNWVLLSDQVSQLCVNYWEYTFVKCFPLQSHWHIFVAHDVVQFTECTPSLSDSPFHFLYLVMVLSHHLHKIYITVDLLDLLSSDNHIILVDMLVTHYFGPPQMHLKAYWLADVMDILQHFLYL